MFYPTFNHTGRKPGLDAFCSMFSQMLKLIPRTEFAQMVKQTRALPFGALGPVDRLHGFHV
jgi:hypothetical protein